MKTKALRVLTGVSAAATAVASLNFVGVASIIPGSWAGYLAIATTGLLALKEIAVVIGDILDNGKRDGSFKG